MTRTYSFKAGSFSPADPKWTEIVAAAYEAQERPVCECGPGKPGMAIARFNGDYYLRRLPGTGLAHDPQCPSFEPPIELSGLGELRGSALLPQDDGTVDLKLGFSLSVGSGRKGPTPGEKKDPITAKAARAKLSLRALLHHLWDQAELTVWHPGMAGKRNWFIVRREILAAARQNMVQKAPLTERLFVPEPWRKDAHDQLNSRRSQFMLDLRKLAKAGEAVGMVLAPLNTIEHGGMADRLILKHMADFPFKLDKKLTEKVMRVSAGDLELSGMVKDSRVIVLATFIHTERGVPEVLELASMAVDPRWLPFATTRELALADSLASRSWKKSLLYSLDQDAPKATGVLLDTERPVALYAPREGISAEALAQMSAAAREGAYEAWLWTPDAAVMPQLPPRRGAVGH